MKSDFDNFSLNMFELSLLRQHLSEINEFKVIFISLLVFKLLILIEQNKNFKSGFKCH